MRRFIFVGLFGLSLLLLFVVGLSLLFLSYAAFAQGTSTEKTACRHDALRFCKRELTKGPFDVAGCLSFHKAHLTLACRKVLDQHGI